MARSAKELSALEVSRLTKPGMHAVGIVPGLYLRVPRPDEGNRTARTWMLRVVIAGKRRDMGLGGYPGVTLAQAREKARTKRDEVKEGADPIEVQRSARTALAAARASSVTFKDAAEKYIKAHRDGWRNAKHLEQWTNTLASTYPVLGELDVREIELPQVLAVLEPIWKTRTETASRLRGRVESVLDWATVRGYRQGLNPARWRGHLDHLLPAPAKIAKTGHHSAVPIDGVAAFMQALSAVDGTGASALEFAVLTAARSGEVRGATWGEIDLANAIWTIPGERMKAGREHRVPLSAPAVKLLKGITRVPGNELVFPAPRGGVLSDMTLVAVMRRMEVDAVPHGFRSTFRDWCSERTNYPREVAEMALAHAIGDKVEAAYRRGDLFDKRRRLMDEWAAFCARPEARRGKVVQMRTKA